MPDMTKWSSSEVMSFCNLIGLKYTFKGYGTVLSTNVSPNTKININSTLEVTLSNE